VKQHPAPRNHISERSPAAGRMHLPGGYLLTENGEDTKGPELLVYETPAQLDSLQKSQRLSLLTCLSRALAMTQVAHMWRPGGGATCNGLRPRQLT
jgi:hypothetical protein